MRRCCHEKIVIRHLRERLAELIGESLLLRRVGAHLVGFINDDQIPVASKQALFGILDPGYPGHRGGDLIFLLPGVRAVVRPQDDAPDHLEPLPELLPHLSLPLKGQVGRRDDENPPDQTPYFQLLDEKPCHYRLSSAGIVRQKETNSGKLEEIVVHGLQLMRQRIDPGD